MTLMRDIQQHWHNPLIQHTQEKSKTIYHSIKKKEGTQMNEYFACAIALIKNLVVTALQWRTACIIVIFIMYYRHRNREMKGELGERERK